MRHPLRTPAKRKKPDASKITFPAIVGYPAVFPSPIGEMLCPWCRKHKVGEPHSMAYLSGGALRRTGKKSYQKADDLAGYLEAGWHGAHPQEGGVGPDANIYSSLSLAEKTDAGQFGFYFCSTVCLRAFLNFCVDKLESAVAKERRKPKTKPIARRK